MNNMPIRNLKRKIKLCLFPLLILFILSVFGTGFAEDYRFSIPKDQVIYWVESDGTVSISYDFTIQNSGKPIDYIDIGMPNNNFNFNNVSATIDGVAVDRKNLTRVDYEETGIRYGLTIVNTANPIPRGAGASIYVEVQQLENTLYSSSNQETGAETASFQFMPSFFSEDFTRGTTDLTVRLVLPKGIQSDAATYFSPKNWVGNKEPESWITQDGNVVYEWNAANANSYTDYIFGAMFPRSVLDSGVKLRSEAATALDQAYDGFNSFSRWISSFSSIIIGFIAVVLFTVFRQKSKRSSRNRAIAGNYLPPQIKAEGEGIKRGLTAVEAAVLLEERMDKIISMIVFSLVKKGVIQIKQQNPLIIEAEEPRPDSLNDYETGFLSAMAQGKDRDKQKSMQRMMSALILSVTEKMKGFSLEETKTYYKNIIEKAWQQVQAADTPELKGEKLDEIFGWAMLDEDVQKKTEETFGDSPVYLPTWWWRMGPMYDRPATTPTSGPIGTPVGTPMPSTPSPVSTPTLPGADFARSITDSVRNFSEGTVGEIRSFTQKVAGTTNPASRNSGSNNRNSGSGRSGGASCACACACAGCACACAGGGGGR